MTIGLKGPVPGLTWAALNRLFQGSAESRRSFNGRISSAMLAGIAAGDTFRSRECFAASAGGIITPRTTLTSAGVPVGVGGTLSSSINFNPNDVGRFSVTYGQGIQNYFNDAPADVGAEVRLGDPRRPFRGVALPIFGMSGFLDHRWNERFTTAIGYSMIDVTNSNAQLPSGFRQGLYASTNLAWYPAPNVMIGGEFSGAGGKTFLTVFILMTSASSSRSNTTSRRNSSSTQ